MASDNIHIKKGEKIIVTCDIYSKTTCVINQKLVMSPPKKPIRIRRNCPMKGCNAANLLKLSNHLRQKHGLQNQSTIQKYLKLAKLVSILICTCAIVWVVYQKQSDKKEIRQMDSKYNTAIRKVVWVATSFYILYNIICQNNDTLILHNDYDNLMAIYVYSSNLC